MAAHRRMEGVKLRLAGGLAALIALVVVAAPAWSQTGGTERSKAVKKVYRDYRDDGVIEACDHTRKALRQTLDDLAPEADVDTPDLRPALEAAIEQVKADDCPEPTPTPTPVAVRDARSGTSGHHAGAGPRRLARLGHAPAAPAVRRERRRRRRQPAERRGRHAARSVEVTPVPQATPPGGGAPAGGAVRARGDAVRRSTSTPTTACRPSLHRARRGARAASRCWRCCTRR